MRRTVDRNYVDSASYPGVAVDAGRFRVPMVNAGKGAAT